MKPKKKYAATEIYALAFGLFLGLAIWKFGNPVILDHKINPPSTLSEFWNDAWPTHWAIQILLPVMLVGVLVVFMNKPQWTARRWLWLLPLLWLDWQLVSASHAVRADLTAATLWQLFGCVACYFVGALVSGRKYTLLWLLPLFWFGWQLLSATQTVDADLTAATVWQFFGCVTCYFIGALVLNRETALRWLLVGVLAAFAFCLVRAVDQRLVEFPQSHQMLMEGERDGWTNVSPAMLLEMKREQVVISTNGMDVANPVFLKKFAQGRVLGTLVYPNALAGAILLLLPLSLTLAFGAKKLRPAIRAIVVVLTCFLGGAGFFWTGSKLGWLIAMALGGLYLFRLKWPVKLKIAALAAMVILGLGIFAVRFHNYFAAGATSAGARLDYWRAAVQTTAKNPLVGTGPGTFPAALRANQIAGRRDGPAGAQRLPRTIFGFGNSRRNFLRGLDCSGAGNCRATRLDRNRQLTSSSPFSSGCSAGLSRASANSASTFRRWRGRPSHCWAALLALTGNQFDKNRAAG